MTPKKLIEYYKTREIAAKASLVTTPTIRNWFLAGTIPMINQHAIAHITNDALKVDKDKK